MGYILSPDELPGCGPYHAEVRRESFYLSGAPNFTWSRIDPDTNQRVFWDDDSRPDGDGWSCDYFERRHGIFVYPVKATIHQGTIEILIEDIPFIRAALDAIDRHLNGAK